MEQIARIAPRALKNHLRRDEAPLLALVTGLWPKMAGKIIAEEARPVAFSAGLLTLSASSDSWRAQLEGLSVEICAAVNKALGLVAVKRVRVRLERGRDSWARQPGSHREIARIFPLDEVFTDTQERLDAGDLARLDPETRAILTHSFCKYFARNRKGVN